MHYLKSSKMKNRENINLLKISNDLHLHKNKGE